MRTIMIVAVLIGFIWFGLTVGEAFMAFALTELILIEGNTRAIRQSLAKKDAAKDNILLG